MSSREVLEAAYRLQLVPNHLFGKTQHKTLHARLSEDILRNRGNSLFTRAAPGRFALRDQRKALERAKGDYVAPQRSYQLKQFDVVCADAREFQTGARSAHGLMLFAFFSRFFKKQVPFRLAEHDPALVHLRLLVVIRDRDRVLTLTALDGAGLGPGRSLGLLGYIKGDDVNLFSSEAYGIDAAAWRTLTEQSTIPVDNDEILSKREAPKALRCVHVAVGGDGSSALIVLTEFDCRSPDELIGHIPAHRSPRWTRVPAEINDLSSLEPVSRCLVAATSHEASF
jgi:hypothetical protein